MMESDLKEMSNEELLKLYKEENSLEVKQELTLRYMYLVRLTVSQMRGAFAGKISVEEMVNEGVIAVMKGIERYDLSLGNKFETYISMRLRGMIIDIIHKNDWLPRDFRKKGIYLEKVQNELAVRLGRQPTEEEIVKEAQMDVSQYRKIQDKMTLMNVLSLDMVMEESPWGQGVQQPSTDVSIQPEESLLREETSRTLAMAVDSLKPNERTVISLYYVEELTMREIAEVMEVSQPRVSQLHSTAIRKLRDYMKNYYNS